MSDVQKVDSVDTGATYVAATSVILGFKNPFDSLDLVSSNEHCGAMKLHQCFNDRFFGSSLEASIFSTSLWKEGLRPATREFSKMLFNPTIDSSVASVVGFNANSNLFSAHSDQHLGAHPYFEGIVVLSRLC